MLRLATRDLGLQSAIAKGALRPKSRFGAGLELLSEGMAQLYFRETRELHTLGAFDLLTLRRGLAGDVGRFAGATALSEVMLKMTPAAPLPLAYDTLTAGLDALEIAPPDGADTAALRALWRLLAVLGFEPSLQVCAQDGAAVEAAGDSPVVFSVADGGVLCPRCSPARLAAPVPPAPSPPPVTRLPPSAYRDLMALNDPRMALPVLDPPHAAAHRRLVARFIRYHLGETAPLSALDFWEHRAWVPPTPSPIPTAAS